MTRCRIQMYVCTLALLFLTSCNSEKRQIRKVLESFEQTTVLLPTDMMYVEDGKRGYGYQDTLIPKLVYYVDSTECSSCAISHMNVFAPVFNWADSLQTFSVVIIISPKEEDQHKTLLDLEMSPFKEKVYVDVNGSFRHSNPYIPSESRYHCFLIDENGHPFFVGNPLAGDRIRSVFFSVLNDNPKRL